MNASENGRADLDPNPAVSGDRFHFGLVESADVLDEDEDASDANDVDDNEVL